MSGRFRVWSAGRVAVALAVGGWGGGPLSAQPCAPAWSDEFALQVPPGMDSSVSALAVYNAELIAGGSFTTAGGVPANLVARWDGSQWGTLGSGMQPSCCATVSALAVYNGELIAGGSFTTAGGVSVNYIARWDGTQWSPLGSGMGNTVLALAVYNGELIAGGSFTTAGGVSANRIARWDGTQWSPLGSGMTSSVSALAVYNGELIAGGSFLTAGGVSANYIARWDGTQWRALGSGMSCCSVSALAAYNGELIAGGDFSTAGGVSANYIARWDGSQWGTLGSGMNNTVRALAVYKGELIAGGSFTTAGGVSASRIARWSGAAWLPVALARGGLAGSATGVVQVPNPVAGLAVRGSSPLGNISAMSIFDGSAWHILPGRGLNFTDLAVFDDGAGPALYVADQRTYKWTGSEWTLLGTGKNDTVSTIEVYDDGSGAGPSLYSAGNFYAAGGVPANRIARWDGEEWSALVTLGGGLADGQANDMAVYDDGSGPALYVAGQFTFVNDDPIAYLGRWNGTSWSRVGGGVNGPVTSLKVLDDGSGPALYIRGTFTRVNSQSSSGGIAANRIARWNGAWDGLGGGVSGTGDVLDLAVFNDGSGPRLHAAGSFTTIGGVPAKRAARWTGSQWESLGNFGLNATARTLAVFHDGVEPGVFFGGDFTVAGGLAARYVAKWNGQRWSVLGLGTSGPVNALAEFESPEARALYIGGNFTSAGGVPASYFTRYEGCPVPPPSAFAILDPPDGASGVSESPLLRWSPAAGAEQYALVISASPGLENPLVSTWTVFPEWPAPGGLLESGRRYYWRVAGANRSGETVAAPGVASFVVGELVPPPCPGDANGDGMVAFSDITSVLENWNADYSPGTGAGDANRNGVVNFADITEVLQFWGAACP